MFSRSDIKTKGIYEKTGQQANLNEDSLKFGNFSQQNQNLEGKLDRIRTDLKSATSQMTENYVSLTKSILLIQDCITESKIHQKVQPSFSSP